MSSFARSCLVAAALVFTLSACGPADGPDDPPPAGPPADAGSVTLDAGSSPDGGEAVDAGPVEEVDAGTPEVDAGTESTDAGPAGCTLDSECLAPSEGHCDAATGRCLSCLVDDHCPADAYCASGVCVPGCHADQGCTNTAEAYCEVAAHRCVECAADGQCGAGKICRDARCVEGCRDDGGCTGGAACCDERCVDVVTDPDNCGRCGTRCSFGAHVDVACTGGECGVGRCAAGFSDCNHDATDGCEVQLAADLLNCGRCGNACPVGPHMRAATCLGGACGVDCEPGFADCDGDPATGCEVDLVNDPGHCGMCDRACAQLPGTSASACGNGLCVLGPCAAGRGDCNQDPGDGCETDTSSDVGHCGACTTSCPALANADVACDSGSCTSACHAGFRDCDGAAGNGCEAALGTIDHCLSCTDSCAVPAGAASATCDPVAGCDVTCPAGHAECDGQPGTVCETDLAQDVLNCGACGHACPARAGATSSCSQGRCGFTCNAGFGDCDHDPANGCEASLLTSTASCGTCGHACTGNAGVAYVCDNGTCADAACDANFRDCDGDPANGCETDVRTSVAHCGTCTSACPARPHMATGCSSGECQYACRPGYADCDGDPANGCEVDTSSSTSDCGACGRACVFPNGSGTCSNGSCQLASCSSGYADCTSAAGCETATTTNANCGGCGLACAIPNRSASCSTGSCVAGACNSGWGDCDGQAGNGCEAPLNTTDNCGACGYRCDQSHGTSVCQSGHCVVTSCAAGYANCDALPGNGCEQALNVPDHCGACYTRPAEVCDGIDNDCNASIDEGCPVSVTVVTPNASYTTYSAPNPPGTAKSSPCPAGTLAVGERLWATTDPSNPYLTGIQLFCAPLILEKVSPSKFLIKPGTPTMAADVGFSGPASADQLCPPGSWLASVTLSTTYVYGKPYVTAVREVGCHELTLEMNGKIYDFLSNRNSFEVRATPQTYVGPLRGWQSLPANDTNLLCAGTQSVQEADTRSEWYLQAALYACSSVGFTAKRPVIQ